jgi:hypothetical protein
VRTRSAIAHWPRWYCARVLQHHDTFANCRRLMTSRASTSVRRVAGRALRSVPRASCVGTGSRDTAAPPASRSSRPSSIVALRGRMAAATGRTECSGSPRGSDCALACRYFSQGEVRDRGHHRSMRRRGRDCIRARRDRFWLCENRRVPARNRTACGRHERRSARLGLAQARTREIALSVGS